MEGASPGAALHDFRHHAFRHSFASRLAPRDSCAGSNGPPARMFSVIGRLVPTPEAQHCGPRNNGLPSGRRHAYDAYGKTSGRRVNRWRRC